MDLTQRRAIEALRAGVPNRDAVRHLGTDQRAVEKRFVDDLGQVDAAMHSLRLPKIVGGLEEVALRLRPDSASYAEMYQRIQDPRSDFDPLFQASLLVHERVKDAEIMSKMLAFWRGEKLDLAETRRSLKVLGLPMQLKQRARAQSYATLARLLGYAPGEASPGLYTVAAGTNDLATVLFEDRRDQERIPQRLADRLPELMPAAQAGMDLLRPSSSARMDLVPQDESALLRTYDKIRDLYETAYDWIPPDSRPDLGERSVRMRQYVRRWITHWDLMRLDPEYRPDIEMRDYRPNLEEQPDLERPAEPARDDEDF